MRSSLNKSIEEGAAEGEKPHHENARILGPADRPFRPLGHPLPGQRQEKAAAKNGRRHIPHVHGAGVGHLKAEIQVGGRLQQHVPGKQSQREPGAPAKPFDETVDKRSCNQQKHRQVCIDKNPGEGGEG